MLLFLLGGFGGGVAILGTLGSGLGQGGIGVIRRSCIAAVGHVILGIVANGTAAGDDGARGGVEVTLHNGL